MSKGIIENATELKEFYINTDITDVSAVQSAIHEIKENVYVAGKESYLLALNEATPANIAKARKYNSGNSITRNIGWILMGVFGVLMAVVDSGFDDPITTWLSLGFWVGVGVQIYISVLKSAWNKLTLSGSVIHPSLGNIAKVTPPTNNIVSNSSQAVNIQKPASVTDKYVFCSQCGRKNKEDASFCENCGSKL